MTLANNTRFAAQDVVWVDAEGFEIVVVICKSTYQVHGSGRVVPLDTQPPVRLNDVPWYPDRDNSSVKFPSDVCDKKGRIDVVVVGEAISKQPVTALDIGVSLGSLTMPLRVHGPRVFYKAMTSMGISGAGRFERLPVQYEFAYGGTSADLSEVELSNPVGLGVASKAAELAGKPAPRIEHPAKPITSSSDRDQPAGFGSIASHWAPRRNWFGTVDKHWQETRMPLFPLDFDYRHYNVANPMLQLEQPLLIEGTPVGVVGMSEDRALSFELPAFRPRYTGLYDSNRQVETPLPDTLLVQPGERQFELVSRAAFRLGRKNQLREVRVDDHG